MIFCIFYQVNLTGSGVLKRTGAEIGCKLDQKCKKIIFYYLKNSKIPKVPSYGKNDDHLQSWALAVYFSYFFNKNDIFCIFLAS